MKKTIYTMHDNERVKIEGKNIIIETVQSLNEWVHEIYCQYAQNSDVIGFSCRKDGYSFVHNASTNKNGEARCSKKDTFKMTTGIAVAYARCMGLPLHPELKYKSSKSSTQTNEKVPIFKVGDVVIGNWLAKNKYSITTEGWIGTVVAVFPEQNQMRVADPCDACDCGFVVDMIAFNPYFGSYKGV